MRSATVKTVIWQGDQLFVVEDIPAQVCGSCLEQYYDERYGRIASFDRRQISIRRSKARGACSFLLSNRADTNENGAYRLRTILSLKLWRPPSASSQVAE
jgi:YgiT-type zinc finger domain-containing protein